MLTGPRTDRLLAFLAEQQIDLAIVGHKQQTPGRRATARRLTMKAPCSVWMIPEGAPATISRILVPIDFSDHSEDTLRDCFRRRLSETLDDAGDVRLLTDGHGLFLRTRQGHIFDLPVDPTQPLVTGDGLPLAPVGGRARKKRKKTARRRA